ncbi:MAG: PQQ-binding-like beta-propeller repeat protein, partial [Akkermansiaceae bacterium]|nr:PQQ-binding-like beta-propeller repeat protein [Akkermansiaceae bacterium]
MKPITWAGLLFIALPSWAGAADWPAWRGDALGSGKTSEEKVPLEWGPEKNVRWRVALPERGNSTPAVHGDRVFVTQA